MSDLRTCMFKPLVPAEEQKPSWRYECLFIPDARGFQATAQTIVSLYFLCIVCVVELWRIFFVVFLFDDLLCQCRCTTWTHRLWRKHCRSISSYCLPCGYAVFRKKLCKLLHDAQKVERHCILLLDTQLSHQNRLNIEVSRAFLKFVEKV